MITLRPAAARGHASHGWLDSWHSFSFADYHDPRHMGFSVLRVINDDRVQPGQGFGMHGHRDMEIVTYLLEGVLEHKDSMGNGSLIRSGEVQRMSAGSGVQHSEFNASRTEQVHFLQIWLLPERGGIAPSYEQKAFPDEDRRGRLCLVASPGGREGSVTLHQDACLYAALLDGEARVAHRFAPGRVGYAHVARGEVTLSGQALQAGDGARIVNEQEVVLSGGRQAEVLLFDLPQQP